MHIKDFQAVLDVYDSKSFSEAAFNSNFSTSAVSKQVARLEKELNVRLFERKNKSREMVLTEMGEQLLPEIRRLVEVYSKIENIASLGAEKDTNVLNVGYVPLIGTIGETEILTTFSKKYPEIQVFLRCDTKFELSKMLASGKIDACFVLMFSAVPSNSKFVDFLTRENMRVISLMRRDELYIGMSKKHKFANRKSIRIEELQDETFIFSNSQNPDKYETRIDVLKEMFLGSNKHIKTRFMDFANVDMVLSVVQSGAGVIPQVVKPLDRGYDIVYVPVVNWPDQVNGLFIYNRDFVSKPLKNLISCVKEYVAEQDGKDPDYLTE